MKKYKVYLVMMHKWTGESRYHLGIYSTKTKAHKAGNEEKAERGGNKYFYEITEFCVDHLPGVVVFKKEQNDDWGWWL